MKEWVRMKYEQFMMRLFDWLMLIFKKNKRLAWYPYTSLGVDIIIDDLEDYIYYLEDEIYYLKNWL